MILVVVIGITACNLIHTHSFGEWSATKNATCIEDGIKTRYCDCGEKQSDTIPFTGHNYVDGECANCGDVKESSVCKHKNLVVLSAIDSTCTKKGLTEGKQCSDCGEILVAQQEAPLKAHTAETIPAVEATCTQTGLTKGKYCSSCGTVIVAQTVIDILEHRFGEWVVSKEATESEGGLKERTCACGEKETAIIPVKIPEAPAYTRDGDYIYFGEYPQTIKADDVTITDTTDSRGYYLGSDGYYYAKVTVIFAGLDYTFSTGVSVTSDSTYYFKVEPIRWRILSEKDGKALLLCDSVIDSMAFQEEVIDSETGYYYTNANKAPEITYANNYKYSNIRAWLNSTFYENAFSEFECSLILKTEVNNSLSSTTDISNPYVCENTIDKIFLLSHAEVTNPMYGFSSSGSDTARMIMTSDYSRAIGVSMFTTSDCYGNGYWWLRSPVIYDDYSASSDDSCYANIIYGNGYERVNNAVWDASCGVVPALRITLEP